MLSVALFFLSFVICIYLSFKKNRAYIFVLYQYIYFASPKTKWWSSLIPDISYSFYVVLLMLLMYAFDKNKFGINNPFKVKPIIYMYILVLLYSVSSFLTPYALAHSIALEAFLTLAVIVSAAYGLFNGRKTIDILANGFMFGAFYLSFYIFQFGRNSGDRVEGVGMPDAPDANGIAAAIAPVLPIFIGYFWSADRNWQKVIYALGGVFCANALILINSRGAFLGVVAGAGFVIWKLFFSVSRANAAQSAKTRLALVALIFMGLGGAAYIADDAFVDRMLTLKEESKLENEGQKEKGSTRVEFWKAAIRMSKDYPFGVGRGGFEQKAPLYLNENLELRSRHKAVHSTWLEALTEIGYLGLLFFVLMVVNCLKMLKTVFNSQLDAQLNREAVKTLGIWGGLICMLVAGTFVSRMRAEVLYWLIILALLLYKEYILKPRMDEANKNANVA